MKKIYQYDLRRALAVLATGLLLGGLSGTTAPAADMYRMALNSGGGIPAQATINMVNTTSNTTFSWYGMRGWSTIEATTNLTTWFPYASTMATEYAWSVTTPKPNGSYMFRLAQTNYYAGSDACSSCHGDKYGVWKTTLHSSALSVLTSIGMGNNASCLPCHTVGFGQPTGYTNQALTPQLANVGCENCHGTAGWHKGSDHKAIRPAVSIDPAICGSCHQAEHHPTYEEYSASLHAQVNDDVKYGFNSGVYYSNTVTLGGTNLYGYYVTTNADLTLKTNATTGIVYSLYGPQTLPNLQYVSIYDQGQDRAVGCGICHSGATRMAMLNDYNDRLAGRTNYLNMPSGHDSGAWGPTCAVCHDPHSKNNTAQLRNPMFSTNYFTMPTTSDKRTVLTTNSNGSITTNVYWMSAAFASLYDPTIQVCGQCHNSRGARWDGRGYGLITNTVVGGPVTNVVYVDIVTWVTNIQVFTNSIPWVTNTYIYSYVSGRYATNVVTANVTNNVIVTGLTTAVSYSRPPHHSPQYNLLSGIVQPDYLNSNGTNTVGLAVNVFGVHSLMSNGCVTCHMPTKTLAVPTPENPNYTGHEFEPLLTGYTGCAVAGCHASPSVASNKMTSLQFEVSTGITNLVTLLSLWATTKGPGLFTTNYPKYLQNSWEYTTPGTLATITNAGPSAAEQLKIPAGIRQARFNLYMVGYGNAASLGVHNPTYTRLLLNNATSKVLGALQ